MSDFKFLYWDEDGVEDEEAIRRMEIIMRNGNSGVHYDIYDDDDEDSES